MAALGAGTGVNPILRTQADETRDYDDTLKNFADGAYTEWPNEAGFDGLTEERGPVEVPVTGSIPTWAAGSLYRTGPGVYKIENTAVGTFYTTHWFDGLAQTHRFDILPDENGSVKMFYSSRRQAEEMMQYIKDYGDRPYFSFGQRRDPCLGLFAKIMSTWRGLRTKPEDKWIETINVAVHPNFPGLEAASGNLIGRRVIDETSAKDPKAGPSNNSGGHLAGLPKDMWITTDNSMLKQVDPRTLEPIGFATQSVLHPDLNGPVSCAHAQRDPITGDLFNFNLQFGRFATYRIFRVSASTGKTEILAAIHRPDLKPAYIHSFHLSPSFVILCVPSSHIAWNGMRIMWERNVLDSIEPFDKSKKCKWFVIDRLHGKGVVAEFETDAGFFFHTTNAFEEQDEMDLEKGTTSLFCEVVEYTNLDVMSSLYYNVVLKKDDAHTKFWGDEQHVHGATTRLAQYRFRISQVSAAKASNPTVGEPTGGSGSTMPLEVQIEKIFSIPGPHSGELPTINPLFATKRHRYVYGMAYRGHSTIMDGIVKTDTLNREVLFWDNPRGHSPGEAIFVPRPGGTKEDDGVLLSVVLDGYTKKSYLLCLNAETMKELGRGEVGFAVAFGFHGVHVNHGLS
ncbi:carotenoid oxygenase [Apodospora peruviana]|uniref:Carotenoid oxygenase n=1 Tax=Apodospora peruviana TaxID=516989 RepID=A0AAE0M2M6_9PEZI|nr:carotenoid oxygenase [Apodospora peruviana]